MSRLRSYLGALGEPRFRLLFLGTSFSTLGSSLIPVALAFAILDLTGSASDLGFVLAARYVPLVLLLLIGGVWADRIPRSIVMLSTDLVQAAAQGVLGFLLLTGQAEVWHFAATQLVAGAAAAFFMPASAGIVPHTVRPDRLQQANGLLGVSRSLLSTLGPAIAGVLLATAGAGWAFVGDSLSYVISAAFLARLRLPRGAQKAEAPNFLAELRTGWREFWTQRWMVAIDGWAVIANMTVIASFLVLGPLVSDRELGGASAWAVIATGFGIGAIVGEVAAVVVRPRRPLVLACVAMTGFALPLVLLAIPAHVLLIAAGAAVAGGSLTLFNTLFVTVMQQQVPDGSLSRVAAYDWLASIAFVPIGYAIVGPVAEGVGVDEVLWTAATLHVVLFAVVVSLPSVRGMRREPVDYAAASAASP